jgi:type VI secretion system secreted protein Hcp
MPDTYIKFDGVDGESQQTGAVNYIEIGNVNISAYAPETSDTGFGQAVGKPQYQPISFITESGAHTPDLMKKFNEGKHFDNVEILWLKQTGAASAEWYRKVTLKHVFIVNYGESKSTDSSGSESVTIKFEEITQEYKKQQADGSLVANGQTTYNNKTNVAS